MNLNNFRIILICLSVMIMSCNKNEVLPDDFSKELSTNPTFIKFSDATSRFDPLYLKMVFNDKRDISEIVAISSKLASAIQKDPKNQTLLSEFAKLFHFKSIIELEKSSELLQNSYQELDQKFNLTNKYKIEGDSKWYFSARKQYLKNKIAGLTRIYLKKDPILVSNSWGGDWSGSEDNYYINIFDSEEEYDGAGGASDGHNLFCFHKKLSCNEKAKGDFYQHAALWGGGGFVGGGTAGAAITAWFAPVSGGVAPLIGGLVGGFFGALGGLVTAQAVYQSDLKICSHEYNACMNSR